MSTQQSPDPEQTRWREELLQALDQQCVPLCWRDRLLEELEDHLTDLKENSMSMDAEPRLLAEKRLGLPHDLASVASAEYRTLGFCVRRPVLTYVAGPLVLTPVLFFAFLLVLMPLLGFIALGIMEVLNPDDHGPHQVDALFAWAFTLILRFVPYIACACLFCWLAERQARDWRWVMSACAIVGLYAAVVFVNLEAATADEKGSLMIGLALPPKELLVVLQAMVPPAIGAFSLWRRKAHHTACRLRHIAAD